MRHSILPVFVPLGARTTKWEKWVRKQKILLLESDTNVYRFAAVLAIARNTSYQQEGWKQNVHRGHGFSQQNTCPLFPFQQNLHDASCLLIKIYKSFIFFSTTELSVFRVLWAQDSCIERHSDLTLYSGNYWADLVFGCKKVRNAILPERCYAGSNKHKKHTGPKGILLSAQGQ